MATVYDKAFRTRAVELRTEGNFSVFVITGDVEPWLDNEYEDAPIGTVYIYRNATESKLYIKQATGPDEIDWGGEFLRSAVTGAHEERINVWTLSSGDLYYADVSHPFSTTELTWKVREFSNDEEVQPELVDLVDNDTLRVFCRGNTEDLVVTVVTGSGPQGPTGPQGPAGGGLANVVEDLTPQLGGTLDMNEQEIQFKVPDADGECCGFTTLGTVDTNATGVGAALYMASDGNWDEADADAAATMPCRVLAVESGTGAGKKLLKWGYLRLDAWNWTPGDDIWVDTTTGALTQTRPTGSGDQVQRVGYAHDADTIFFDPDSTVVEIA